MLSPVQGVTKRCRLSRLTNCSLVYEPECWGRGGVAGFQPMSTEAQINFGDITPYSTYGPVGNHIVQELITLYLTRFRTYKIARPPQTKTSRRGGGFRQINTGRKVPSQVNFLDY